MTVLRRSAALAALVATLGACGGTPPGDLVAVPTQPATWIPFAVGCPDALLEGELVADEEFGFVVAHPDGFTSPVTWPHGYVARDTLRRELLDGWGRVVAREGDSVALGGGEGSAGPGHVVCGQFEVIPAS